MVFTCNYSVWKIKMKFVAWYCYMSCWLRYGCTESWPTPRGGVRQVAEQLGIFLFFSLLCDFPWLTCDVQFHATKYSRIWVSPLLNIQRFRQEMLIALSRASLLRTRQSTERNFKTLSRILKRTKKDETKEITPHLSPGDSDEEPYRIQVEIGAFTLANSSSVSSISEDGGVEDRATSLGIEEK